MTTRTRIIVACAATVVMLVWWRAIRDVFTTVVHFVILAGGAR